MLSELDVDLHRQVSELFRDAIMVDEIRILMACAIELGVSEQPDIEHHRHPRRQVIVTHLRGCPLFQALCEPNAMTYSICMVLG